MGTFNSLLVGMENGASASENSPKAPQKVKHRVTI